MTATRGLMAAVLLAGAVLLWVSAGSAVLAAPAGGASAQIATPTALPVAPIPNPTAWAPAGSASFYDNTGFLPKPPFATLADFNTAAGAVARGGDAEAFWKKILSTQQMPLIFGNTAIFVYRGKAGAVEWRGDFTRWNSLPALRGRRLGNSDIWLAAKTFPLDARLDYKVVVDGRQSPDPLNPLSQMGGYGRNSVLRMPDYVYPDVTLPRAGVPRGKTSEPQTIDSQHLKYGVRYWVYAPRGYERMRDLPTIYVTDGQEYMNPEMGALPVVLDNLIAAGSIEPVVAVFIDPRNPQTGENRRGPELLTNDRFETFLMRELVPAVEAAYPVSRQREGRALLGASLGGLRATWAIMRNPEMWGMAAIQSPYFKAKPRVLGLFAESKRLPVKVFVNQGTYDLDVEGGRKMRDILRSKGYEYQFVETNDGHSYGNWRGQLAPLLKFFFGKPED